MLLNLRDIEKRIKGGGNNIQPLENNSNGRVNNPIAAAFAHRLAMFVKNTNQNTNQSQQVLARIDSERGSNAGVKNSAR
jgi:hypothetical protein